MSKKQDATVHTKVIPVEAIVANYLVKLRDAGAALDEKRHMPLLSEFAKSILTHGVDNNLLDLLIALDEAVPLIQQVKDRADQNIKAGQGNLAASLVAQRLCTTIIDCMKKIKAA